jgi:hypothetical protein
LRIAKIKTDIKSFPHSDFWFIMVRAFQNAAQHSSSSVARYGGVENKLFENLSEGPPSCSLGLSVRAGALS